MHRVAQRNNKNVPSRPHLLAPVARGGAEGLFVEAEGAQAARGAGGRVPAAVGVVVDEVGPAEGGADLHGKATVWVRLGSKKCGWERKSDGKSEAIQLLRVSMFAFSGSRIFGLR